jgi:hypothetical protein
MDNAPLQIVHYDHKSFFSTLIRADLADYFADKPHIKYVDISTTVNSEWDEITPYLQGADVFLCHPGQELQREFFSYCEQHTDLKSALVIPGDKDVYDVEFDFPVLRYKNIESIIKFCESPRLD